MAIKASMAPRRLFLGILFAAAVGAAGGTELEEVVVTAQKREQSIQDVGIAITALSGEQLKTLAVRESVDIAAMTPGVHIAGSAANQFLMFNIRGVSQNDFADIAEAPNAVYIDEAYIAMMNSGQFPVFDMARVEVLKGPQGTLFGRNSTGGLVHYVSHRPTREFEAYTDLMYGSYNQARVEAAVSGPLSSSVAGRLAVYYNRFDEVLENILPGADDLFNDDTYAGRAQLLWDVSDSTNLWLSAYGYRTKASTSPYQSRPTIAVFDADGNLVNSLHASPDETRFGVGPAGENTCPSCLLGEGTRPVPGGDFFGYIDPDGDGNKTGADFAFDDSNTSQMLGTSAKLLKDLNGINFTALVDYKRTEKDQYLEPESAPVNLIVLSAIAQTDQFSSELRFDGEWDRARWVTGLYYLTFDTDVPRTGLIIPALTPGGANALGAASSGVELDNPMTLKTDSYSAFGEADWQLTGTVSLITGLRFTRESKEFTHQVDLYSHTSGTAQGALLVPNLNPAAFQNLETDDPLWSGKLQLNWRPPLQDLLLYAGINRGVKAGGFNQQLAGLPPTPDFSYKEETLTSYEVGFKSSGWDNRLRLNGSFYYYDYADHQAWKIIGFSTYVINADAIIKGFELELGARPFEGFDLALGASYVDATVKDVPFASGPGGTETTFLDREPGYTPDVQVEGMARYAWPAFGGGTMAVQADFNYASDYYFYLTNFDSTRFDSRLLTNARVSYEAPSERWQLDLFVRNITDERPEVISFDHSVNCGCSSIYYGPPRWFGASLRYTWR